MASSARIHTWVKIMTYPHDPLESRYWEHFELLAG